MTDGNSKFVHDLINHITNTHDKNHIDGKYTLLNNVEMKDILFSIPIPARCKTIGDAYFLGSIMRRMVSYIQEGDPKEALKTAHELSLVYEVKP